MQPTTKAKQPDLSFIAFLGSPHAWPVWIMMSVLLVAFAIAILLAAATGLAFAVMNRPQMASSAQMSATASPPESQHK